MSKECTIKKTSIGGQALIEGVMMRGPHKTAMAVRHTSGVIKEECWDNPTVKWKTVRKIPFVRGIFNFADSMIVGYKSLMRSVDLSGMAEEEDAKAKKKADKEVAETVGTATEAEVEAEESAAETVEESPAEEAVAEESPAEDKPEEKKKDKGETVLMTVVMTIASVLGIALGIGLFVWLPSFLYNLAKPAAPWLENRLLQSLCEGLLRIAIFLGYISMTALMKDIRRVYMYHGAEHKTIFCYESGLPLTVENARSQTRFHPRCGTSFLILVLIIGIIIGLFIPTEIDAWLRASIKILLLPLTMGVGYEAIKLAGRTDNVFTRIMSAPGLWIQRITTREPTDDMLECAIAAFKQVLPENEDEAKW